MGVVKLFSGQKLPLEMHKVRVVQKLNLLPVEARQKAMAAAGNNTFLLRNEDVFLDMLTDSGVNAMSDQQTAAMMIADDSYAGSATYYRLESKVCDLFGTQYFLPAHQGRACESILAESFVKPGNVVPMNFHFTTAKAHITRVGGRVEEIVIDEGLNPESDCQFKGNIDLDKLKECISRNGAENIAFIRLEAGTNLIGGQPFSLENMTAVAKIAKANGIMVVLDASLMQDNLHFIKTREAACKDMTIREITRALCDNADIIYFSARKLGFARGGGIAMNDKGYYERMKDYIPLFEGFLTYGGMSVREMEAMTVGLEETMDETVISQGPQFIEFMASELIKRGVPVVTPRGRPRLPHQRQKIPLASGRPCLPRGGPRLGGLHRGRRARHGARHALRAARAGRNGAHREHGAAAPRPPAPRVHHEPDSLRRGSHQLAVRKPRDGRRPELRRGARHPPLLLRETGTHRRLAGEAGCEVPQGLWG